MASKYAQIFAKLAKVLNVDPAHQDKVNAVKQAMADEPGFRRHASALAASYAAVRREMDAINAAMCDQYEAEGTTALTLDNGDNVRIQPKLWVSFPDPEAFRLWCLQDEDLRRKMVLHPSTASSLVSQMLLDGLAEPPGAKASVVDQAVFTKGK